MKFQFTVTALILSSLLGVCACGVKGAPLYPEAVAPEIEMREPIVLAPVAVPTPSSSPAVHSK